jgi:uncharacterized RDD family membrane protein YckC
MSADFGLAVNSTTGIDLTLPVAGPGARSFAFLIDWNIRVVLSLAWYVVAALAYNRGWNISPPLNADATWFVCVLAPSAAVYCLYHVVIEIVTGGRTPGKRMAGVRIVSYDGGTPSIGALLIRNVFRLIDSLPVAYAIGLLTTMLTSHHVRIGDLAAGTLIVYVRPDSILAQTAGGRWPQNPLDSSSTELARELLERWPTLDRRARDRLARALMTKSTVTASDSDAQLREQLVHLAEGIRE